MVRLIPNEAEEWGAWGTLLLLQQVKLSSAIICNDAKVSIQDEFNQKVEEASFHWKGLSHSSHGQMHQKEKTKEMNKGSGRHMINSKVPKRLWDYCLDLESYIRSKANDGVYKINGEVYETIMSGMTSNISQFFWTWIIQVGHVLRQNCTIPRGLFCHWQISRTKYRSYSCHHGKDYNQKQSNPP